MISAIIYSMLGEYTPPSKQINQDILSYKSEYLYSDQYKKCVRNGFYSTYIFNEPLSCIPENFIQGAMFMYGVKSTYSNLPDNIHVLKRYTGSGIQEIGRAHV